MVFVLHIKFSFLKANFIFQLKKHPNVDASHWKLNHMLCWSQWLLWLWKVKDVISWICWLANTFLIAKLLTSLSHIVDIAFCFIPFILVKLELSLFASLWPPMIVMLPLWCGFTFAANIGRGMLMAKEKTCRGGCVEINRKGCSEANDERMLCEDCQLMHAGMDKIGDWLGDGSEEKDVGFAFPTIISWGLLLFLCYYFSHNFLGLIPSCSDSFHSNVHRVQSRQPFKSQPPSTPLPLTSCPTLLKIFQSFLLCTHDWII